MSESSPGFWSTFPGILTGIAAVITSATGLYIAISNNNTPDIQSDEHIVIDPGTNKKPDKASEPITTRTEAKEATVKEAIIKEDSGTKKITVQAVKYLRPFPSSGALVNCALFPTVNTVKSLMSWSNYYHKQIIDAGGIKTRALGPCSKTIDYRGMAHCKASDDPQIRQAFLETLLLCRKAGIEWQDIQHETIIGR